MEVQPFMSEGICMRMNEQITEEPPYKFKGICAECNKNVQLDSEHNAEFDFLQIRRYGSIVYKIDYHFCSKECLRKKLKSQPISNVEARADERRSFKAKSVSVSDFMKAALQDPRLKEHDNLIIKSTAKEIFKELDAFIEPMDIYDEKGNKISMPTLNLVKYLEYQKKHLEYQKKQGIE